MIYFMLGCAWLGVSVATIFGVVPNPNMAFMIVALATIGAVGIKEMA